MKTKLIILFLLCNLSLNFVNAKGLSLMKPKPRVTVKFIKSCDDGFGYCIALMYSFRVPSDDSEAATNWEIEQEQIIISVPRFELSTKLEDQFTAERELVIEHDTPISDDICEALEISRGTVIRKGNYRIDKDAENFTIRFDISAGR